MAFELKKNAPGCTCCPGQGIVCPNCNAEIEDPSEWLVTIPSGHWFSNTCAACSACDPADFEGEFTCTHISCNVWRHTFSPSCIADYMEVARSPHDLVIKIVAEAVGGNHEYRWGYTFADNDECLSVLGGLTAVEVPFCRLIRPGVVLQHGCFWDCWTSSSAPVGASLCQDHVAGWANVEPLTLEAVP